MDCMHHRTLSICLISLAMSPLVGAQTFVCPSGPAAGQRQVGMTGGGPGLAAVPVCVQNGSGSAAPRQQSGSSGSAIASIARSQIAIMNEGVAILKEGVAIEKDPEFQKLRKGYWKFYSDKKNPRSGKECQVLYGSLTGAIIFAGPSSTFNGATMTFMGQDIPQPSSLEKIRVDLTQDADPPQNISALNFVSPDSPGIGRLTFQLSNPSEMVKTMEDNYSVKVSMDGKEILKTSYKEGNKAREFLQQCLAGRPPINP